jgi:hypothetical protein
MSRQPAVSLCDTRHVTHSWHSLSTTSQAAGMSQVNTAPHTAGNSQRWHVAGLRDDCQTQKQAHFAADFGALVFLHAHLSRMNFPSLYFWLISYAASCGRRAGARQCRCQTMFTPRAVAGSTQLGWSG